MKRIFIKIVLLLSLGLTGCATNTQNQNTAAGAFTGAIAGGLAGNALAKQDRYDWGIGLGMVSGAVIGAFIGHYLDSTDHNRSYPILSQNPMTNPSSWVDPRTHVSYQMSPTSNLYTVQGNPNCRDFHYTSTSYKKMNAFDGTACYVSNGHWEYKGTTSLPY